MIDGSAGRLPAINRSSALCLLLLSCIFVLGLGMRLIMVSESSVQIPLRADALEYYSYAANMKYFGTYSKKYPGEYFSGEEELAADAERNPGYPLFLMRNVVYPPDQEMLQEITHTQAVIDSLLILLVYAVGWMLMNSLYALLPALLVAISPHLIAMNIYILTEALTAFALTVAVACFCLAFRRAQNTWLWFYAGLALGGSFLIKASLSYCLVFIVPALVVTMGLTRKSVRASGLVVVGYLLVISPWQIYNAVGLDGEGSTAAVHAVGSLHNGTYPQLMYNDDPATQALPHRFDPDYNNYQTFAAVLGKLWERANAQPAKYLEWYLWGKAKMMFSWGIVGRGGEVFVYPVYTTPYHTRAAFLQSYQIMQMLHWPLVIAGLFGAVMVWLPRSATGLPPATLAGARIASALLAYFVAIHVVTTPLARYSIPLRPVLFLLSTLWLYVVLEALAGKLRGTVQVTDEQ